jgi:hypothetical protein
MNWYKNDKRGWQPSFDHPNGGLPILLTEKLTLHDPMETPILSSPTAENFVNSAKPERFYRLYLTDFIDFCQKKYAPAVMKIYYFIKTNDPFGNGLQLSITETARILKYHKRTVSRAIKTLINAGELAIALVEAHVKIVATAVESKAEIVSKLGLVDIPAPPTPEPPIAVEVVTAPITPPTSKAPIVVEVVTAPITPPAAPLAPIPVETVETVEARIPTPPTAPQPQQNQSTPTTTGFSSVSNIISKLGIPEPTTPTPTIDTDSTLKTPEWYARIESRLNVLDIKLTDVHHALKKYPILAIEDAIVYTQKQTWAKSKAGVFVSYLKKWTPTSNPIRTSPTSKPEPVVTELMKRFPDIANTLSKEQNPIDKANLDYLERLRIAELIYNVQYSTIYDFFGVFITCYDYPHPIPWWDAIPQLQQLYPDFV